MNPVFESKCACNFAVLINFNPMKKAIENREDLSFLVRTFYAKVRTDAELGPFFNETIKDWEEHLEKLTDFWESTLFSIRKYKGNPVIAHAEVDRNFDNRITPNEFGIWLNYWIETINENFEGEKAETLKERARRMGTHLYVSIYQSRHQ